VTISFARHQFPPAIIRHAVWLYLRFTPTANIALASRGPWRVRAASSVSGARIVTSTVFTAYYLLLSTKRIERIQWVNELTKGGVRAFAGEM
jgi:hypothetical protein